MCAGALLCHSAWCWWVALALCALAVGFGTAARRAEEVAPLAAALALAARGNRRIAEAEERMAGHGSRHGR